MFSLNKLFKSFSFALEGIFVAFSENQNLKIHLIIAILVVIAAVILQISYTDFILIMIMIVLVFSAEMINTAIEEVVNLLVKEHRIEAKIAKDVCAGMVLVISLGAVVVGALIFIPYFFR